jgi:ribosomal protein L23
MRDIEENNSLAFIVDIKADMRKIKESVTTLYGLDAIQINTLVSYV